MAVAAATELKLHNTVPLSLYREQELIQAKYGMLGLCHRMFRRRLPAIIHQILAKIRAEYRLLLSFRFSILK